VTEKKEIALIPVPVHEHAAFAFSIVLATYLAGLSSVAHCMRGELIGSAICGRLSACSSRVPDWWRFFKSRFSEIGS
jgi:hypothetical protein